MNSPKHFSAVAGCGLLLATVCTASGVIIDDFKTGQISLPNWYDHSAYSEQTADGSGILGGRRRCGVQPDCLTDDPFVLDYVTLQPGPNSSLTYSTGTRPQFLVLYYFTDSAFVADLTQGGADRLVLQFDPSCSTPTGVFVRASSTGPFYGGREGGFPVLNGYCEIPFDWTAWCSGGLFDWSAINYLRIEAYSAEFPTNTCDFAGQVMPYSTYRFLQLKTQQGRSPDIAAVSLAWNTSQGGADFQYTVNDAPLPTATTAKLFWASGPNTGNIISITPIFAQSLPLGASGPSAVIHVPTANFANPPAVATYVLLVLDPDNLVQESNEGNNVAALALCPVGPWTTQCMSCPTYDESYLAVELRDALACLRSKLPPGGWIQPTCGYRSTEVQMHFLEVKHKFQQLLQVPGVRAYVDYDQYGHRRPQLGTTPDATICLARIDEVNAEITRHGFSPSSLDLSPVVGEQSLHELGRAVDMVFNVPTGPSIDVLARRCRLYRPLPKDDPVHFQLTGDGPRTDIRFEGHSPLNLLATDPLGRRVGFDPLSGSVVNEIGSEASYSGTNTTPQIIEFLPSAAVAGQYTLSGVGTGTGAYLVKAIVSYDDEAELVVEKVLATGTAQPGQPLSPIPPMNCLYSTMALDYSLEGQDLRLLAPPWATNIVVESTRALTPASWTEVTQTISPSDGVLITNLPSGSQFFRLRTK